MKVIQIQTFKLWTNHINLFLHKGVDENEGIQSEVTWNDFKKGKANSGPMDSDEWLGMTATQTDGNY